MLMALAWLAGLMAHLRAATLPTSAEVTIEGARFGDVASILKVDSTVVSFRFDAPVSYLALVLEAYPKESTAVPVGRLALELTKPVKEGRLCVQMADQGFLPLGNGAPHQMQLFMQVDCGGSLVSSSQSFLKEKFNFSRSLARAGEGTLTRKVTGNRVPVLWLMGNSDSGTYFNDDDLGKMIAKNHDAYILIGYLEITKEPLPEVKPATVATSTSTPPGAADSLFVGPPYPVPAKGVSPAAPAASPAAEPSKPPKKASEPIPSNRSSTSKTKKRRS